MEIMNEQQPLTPLQVAEPKHFGLVTIVVFNAITSVLGGIAGIIFALGPLTFLAGLLTGNQIFFIAGRICLVIISLIVFFLPLMASGSPYIVHLVRKIRPPSAENKKSFVVQMTLSPRLHTGVRGFLEDADDIGLLTFTDNTIIFYGDQTTLKLPIDSITEVSTRNIGFRGLWVCGYCTRLRSNLLSDHEFVEFADRSPWTVISAFQRSKEIFTELQPNINSTETSPCENE